MAVRQCLKAGASACLFKDTNEQQLLSALMQVVNGRAVLDPRIAGAMLPRRANGGRAEGSLTDRERDVLLMIARGLTTQEIGEQLGLSPNTVKSHSRALFGKLGAHNRVQALAVAQERGLI
jgi:DNA-binding NarL/FixJ family response regulator